MDYIFVSWGKLIICFQKQPFMKDLLPKRGETFYWDQSLKIDQVAAYLEILDG